MNQAPPGGRGGQIFLPATWVPSYGIPTEYIRNTPEAILGARGVSGGPGPQGSSGSPSGPQGPKGLSGDPPGPQDPGPQGSSSGLSGSQSGAQGPLRGSGGPGPQWPHRGHGDTRARGRRGSQGVRQGPRASGAPGPVRGLVRCPGHQGPQGPSGICQGPGARGPQGIHAQRFQKGPPRAPLRNAPPEYPSGIPCGTTSPHSFRNTFLSGGP